MTQTLPVPARAAAYTAWLLLALLAAPMQGIASTAEGEAAYARKDYAAAVQHWRIAAHGGDARAQALLAGLYRDGEGVVTDHAAALRWFGRSAEAGHAPAMVALGRMHSAGQGVPADRVPACEWYEKAARTGDPEGQMLHGACLYRGIRGPQDAEGAARWYARAAAQDHAGGTAALAWQYFYGDGVPKDIDKARELARRAAAQDSASALNLLAHLHLEGHGTPVDVHAAIPLLERSAALDNTVAMYTLGRIYWHKDAVQPRDEARALQWFERAARAGDADAALFLGAINYQRNDPAAAEPWLQQAADAGELQANMILAGILIDRLQEPGVAERIHALVMPAAEGGLAGGQRIAGILALGGIGTTPDAQAARSWFDQAAAQGDEPARCALTIFWPDGQFLGSTEDVSMPALLAMMQAGNDSNCQEHGYSAEVTFGEE